MGETILWMGGGLLTLSGALIGYFAWAFPYHEGQLEKDAAYRKHVATWLIGDRLLRGYRETLTTALDFLQRWMGRPYSLRAFGVCVTVAMIYPVLFFVVSWTFDGPGSVGQVELMPARSSAWRTMVGSLLAVWLVAILVLATQHDRIDRLVVVWLARRWTGIGSETAERLARLYCRRSGVIVAAFCVLLLVAAYFWMGVKYSGLALGTILSFSVVVSAVYSTCLCVAFAMSAAAWAVIYYQLSEARKLTDQSFTMFDPDASQSQMELISHLLASVPDYLTFSTFMYILVCAHIVPLYTALINRIHHAHFRPVHYDIAPFILSIGGIFVTTIVFAQFFLFVRNQSGAEVFGINLIVVLIALPFANALLDWPSWWVSRGLGRHLEGVLGRAWAALAIAGHVVVDLIAAVAFLYALAVLLPFVIEVFNLWSVHNGNPKPLALEGFIEQAVEKPWPNAVWVLLMLLSTLVPTLLHAGALVPALLMAWLHPNAKRARIAHELVTNASPSPAAIRSAAWHMTRTWLIAIVSPILMLGLIVWLVGVLWGSVGGWLAGAAYWGIDLAHALARVPR